MMQLAAVMMKSHFEQIVMVELVLDSNDERLDVCDCKLLRQLLVVMYSSEFH